MPIQLIQKPIMKEREGEVFQFLLAENFPLLNIGSGDSRHTARIERGGIAALAALNMGQKTVAARERLQQSVIHEINDIILHQQPDKVCLSDDVAAVAQTELVKGIIAIKIHRVRLGTVAIVFLENISDDIVL